MSAVAVAEIGARTYADDEALLGGVLDEVICAVEGPEALELHRQAIELGERSRSGERRGRRPARAARRGPRPHADRAAHPHADALVSAHEPRRGSQPRAPHPHARRAARAASRLAACRRRAARRRRHERRGAARDARRRRGAPRPHRASDRGPPLHDRQQARADLRAAARARRAPSRARPARADPPPDRGRRAGDVGLRRAARGDDDRARRGPCRAHLLQLDARRGRARGLPRPRGDDPRDVPGLRRAGAAAAELRLLDRRRSRRQPQRHAADDGRGARADEGLLPATPRGGDPGAGQPDHAVGTRRRRARAAARPARDLEQRFPDVAALARQRSPEEPYRRLFKLARRAPARDAQGLGRRLPPARRAARRPARRRARRCASRTPRSSPRTRCTTSSARSRCSAFTSRCSTCARTPPSTARRSTRSSRCSGCRRATRSSTRRSGWRVLDARDRRPPAADPAGHQRLQRRHARGRGDVPHAARPAARRSPRHDRLLRHLQHDLPVGSARGAAVHEGGRARPRRRPRRPAADRAAVRVRRDARARSARRSARCSRRPSTAPRWTPSASRR